MSIIAIYYLNSYDYFKIIMYASRVRHSGAGRNPRGVIEVLNQLYLKDMLTLHIIEKSRLFTGFFS